MYRMRRTEKAMSQQEAEDFLRAQLVGRLAVISDGEPYAVPLHYVLHDGVIYFHSARGGRKTDAIGESARVCFLVDELIAVEEASDPCASSTWYRSVMVFARAEVVRNPAEKQKALMALLAKYADYDRGDDMLNRTAVDATAVVRLAVDEISGKENLPPGGSVPDNERSEQDA